MEEKIYNFTEDLEQTTEWCREQGKLLFWDESGNEEQKKYALNLLVKAQVKEDPEATYLIGSFIVNGLLGTAGGSSVEHGLSLIAKAANLGWIQARVFLDGYCEKKYRARTADLEKETTYEGPLKDFDGKEIFISRKGLMTPIDAELTYEEGCNILTLSANIKFVYGEKAVNQEAYEQAVLEGIRQWQGVYQVFGNQTLEVKMNLTTEPRKFDNVTIVQLGKEYMDSIYGKSKGIVSKIKKMQLQEAKVSQRLSGTSDEKWSATSRKTIYMKSANGKYEEYEQLKALAKHEFGHALGLGELSFDPQEALNGVEKGSYEEIDSYYIGSKMYNLVMCDPFGPVSNNDLEMVVLAFRENKKQSYQIDHYNKKISEALGKGN